MLRQLDFHTRVPCIITIGRIDVHTFFAQGQTKYTFELQWLRVQKIIVKIERLGVRALC